MRSKKILVLCPHPVGFAPSQRLKFEQYYTSWSANGFDITVSSFFSTRMQQIVYKKGHNTEKIFWTIFGYGKRIFDLFRLRRYHLVYTHLWITPFGPPIFEWLVTSLSRNIIFDIDDLIYLKNNKGDKWYNRFLKGREKPIYLMKKANHVITCTPYLDEFVKRYNPNTTDISSTINTDTYIPVNKYENSSPITLGWSGSHSTLRYLTLLHPVLKELIKSHEFKLLVMGGGDFTLEGVPVEAHAWSEEKEISILQRMDIGLYPLPLDEEWVYGKSGLKALQYMALGLPVIATAIGANFRVIENNESGFLVSTNQQWLEKLKMLIEDASMRKKIGMKARQTVEQFYSIKANELKYLAIINQVLRS